MTSGYDARTAVERELALRLASLLWRLRRANTVETYLLEIQAQAFDEEDDLVDPACGRNVFGPSGPWPPRYSVVPRRVENQRCSHDGANDRHGAEVRSSDFADRAYKMAYSFLQLASHDSGIFERLSRYEAALWRQTVQTLLALQPIRLR